jgi:hypothetical protein
MEVLMPKKSTSKPPAPAQTDAETEPEVDLANLELVVETIKKKNPGRDVYLGMYAGEPFIYLSLNREAYATFRSALEAMDVATMPDDDAINSMLVAECVKYPEQEELGEQLNKMGGLLTSLANDIQLVSGFQATQPPVKL